MGPPAGGRYGIATAVVVNDRVYLVDLGIGATSQLARAGYSMEQVRAAFITHLHSDHVADLAPLLLLGPWALGTPDDPIPLFGPANRGRLTPLSPLIGEEPAIVAPESPTPGLSETVAALERAFATDLNDRSRDTLKPRPTRYFSPHDLPLPENWDADMDPPPRMTPVEVYADNAVRVTATLVRHPPMAPAYAFRFDTVDASVTISGDTAPSENLEQLAFRTDLLLHEALDFDGILAARPPIAEWSPADRSTFEHHRRSHTSPRDAVLLAERAQCRTLAFHHLAPARTPPVRWREAAGPFEGELLIPADLEIIDVHPAAQTSPA